MTQSTSQFSRIGAGFLGMAAGLLLLSGCASMHSTGEEPSARAEANDPLEIPNRFVFALNETVDTFVLRPAAVTYDFWMPTPGKTAVRSFLDYLRSPVILANDLFQGEWDRAETTLTRFAINTATLGVYDLAAYYGYPKHSEDFGQTLALHGVGEGPYLVLPLLGPSNPRDAVGVGVDMVLDPLNWYAWNTDRDWITYTRAGVGAVDARARSLQALDDVKANSLDYYATIRSLYRQRRAAEIRNAGTSDDSGSDAYRDFLPGGKDAKAP